MIVTGKAQRSEDISGQGITAEIIAIISEFRVLGHDGLGQCHAGFVVKDVFKAVEIGETALFSPERSLPLGQKIVAVDGRAFVDGQCGFIGIEGGADAEDLLRLGIGETDCRSAIRSAKFPPSEKPMR